MEALSFDDVAAAPSGEDPEREVLASRLVDIERRQERLVELYEIGGLSIDAVQKRAATLTDEANRARAALDALDRRSSKLTRPELAALLADVPAVRAGSLDEQRALLVSLIDRIELMPNHEVHIVWNF